MSAAKAAALRARPARRIIRSDEALILGPTEHRAEIIADRPKVFRLNDERIAGRCDLEVVAE